MLTRALVTGLVMSACFATATAGQATVLPAFQPVRADEDWSSLRDPAKRAAAPAFKYMPLSPDGSTYLSLGGELRERVDVFDAPRFGIGTRSDSYVLQRILAHADLHAGRRLRLFMQLGREDAFGKRAPLAASDADSGDLQNLFLDVAVGADRRMVLRFGRQELLFNPAQRFVAVRESPNVRQSFDGMRALWKIGGHHFNAFAMRPVEYRPGAFNDRSDRNQVFYGLYESTDVSARASVDLYYLGLLRDGAKFQGVTGREQRHSLGARVAGRATDWDYDFEAIAQSGRFAGQDIRAWALGAIAGYTFKRHWSPRIGLEIDAGSGDRNPADRRIGTFNPMFPRGSYFNDTALNSWANGIYVRPSLGVRFNANLTAQAALLARWREQSADAVYVQPYTAIAESLRSTADSVGRALELRATWKASRSLTLTGEAVHQVAGPAVTAAGGANSSYGMLIAQYRF